MSTQTTKIKCKMIFEGEKKPLKLNENTHAKKPPFTHTVQKKRSEGKNESKGAQQACHLLHTCSLWAKAVGLVSARSGSR